MCAREIVTRPKVPEASTSERRRQEKANAARPVRYAMDCATGKSRGQEKKTEGNTWSLSGLAQTAQACPPEYPMSTGRVPHPRHWQALAQLVGTFQRLVHPQGKIGQTMRGEVPSSQPAWLTVEFYAEKIQPRLAEISAGAIASLIGVSRWYAGRIRQGYCPHPRHWQSLADLVGVSRDSPRESN
jgi:hypothetical protein